MEFPFGHHKHHHHQHHHNPDQEDKYPPPSSNPPPSQYPYEQPPPPPPPVYEPPHHHYDRPSFNEHQPSFERPPPFYADYPPPPPPSGYSEVQHVSHEVGGGRFEPNPTGFGREDEYGYLRNPISSSSTFVHQHHHHRHEKSSEGSGLFDRPSVRVYCRAGPDYSLSIRDNKVVLVRSDPDDIYQHWIKDERYSTKVKDEEGFPSFALVNKATGQAIKHSIGANHPVQLCPYEPDVFDESVLWTESRDTGDGYRAVRMVNNIRLNFDAFHGDKDHGGVRDGTTVVLWDWWKGDNFNQRWKIVPY